MGPPIFIGGNRKKQEGRANSITGFNGAADFHRRKFGLPVPPRWMVSGFNGAADFHRRKSRASLCLPATDTSLQWGRRFSSAEMNRLHLGGQMTPEASMGPPIFIGGNMTGIRNLCFAFPRFNGAADFHRRKCLPRWSRFSRSPASMGPPIFIGGNIATKKRVRTQKRSFNGAADFHRRKSRGETLCGRDNRASMGPPIFIGGNF